MLLSYQQAPVRSGTRTSSRANAVSVAHHRVTTGATARRGAVGRKVSCSAVAVIGDTQSSGGGRSNGPGQDKQTGGGGDPEGRSEAPGWWRLDGDVVRTIAPILAIGVIYRGLVTKVDLAESEGRVTKRVDEKVADVQKSVTESEGRVQKSVTESEGRVQKSLESVQKSVGTLHILVIVQAIVGAFVAGLSVAVLFAGKGTGSK